LNAATAAEDASVVPPPVTNTRLVNAGTVANATTPSRKSVATEGNSAKTSSSATSTVSSVMIVPISRQSAALAPSQLPSTSPTPNTISSHDRSPGAYPASEVMIGAMNVYGAYTAPKPRAVIASASHSCGRRNTDASLLDGRAGIGGTSAAIPTMPTTPRPAITQNVTRQPHCWPTNVPIGTPTTVDSVSPVNIAAIARARLRRDHDLDDLHVARGDLSAGLGLIAGRWQFTFTQVRRTREFKTQKQSQDNFGSLSVSRAF